MAKSKKNAKPLKKPRTSSARKTPIDEREVIHSDRHLPVHIDVDHAKRGKRRSEDECVVAVALKAGPMGQVAENFLVGPTSTKVLTHTKIIIFRTPRALADALKTFDDTGKWGLTSGEYRLMPGRNRQNRFHNIKGKAKATVSGTLNRGKVRPQHVPTRHITNISVLKKMA